MKLITPWIIELDGERFDLRELLSLNSLPDINIMEENGRFYLRAAEFNSITEPEDILNRGTEILRVINGIAHLEIPNWENVKVSGVARDEPNGKRTQFIFPESMRSRSRISSHTSVVEAGHTVDNSYEKSPLPSFLEVAKKNANVEKALRIYGSREHSWPNLYIIFEIIESDVGGKTEIINKGWSSNSKIRKFKHTADSVGAVGDDARHGMENTDPPSSPMPLSEAESMIENILREWIRAK